MAKKPLISPDKKAEFKKEVRMNFGSCMKTIGLVICLLGFVTMASAQPVWIPDTRLTYDDSTSYFSTPTQWAISADTYDRVHVVWYDTRGGYPSEVYYKRSTDNGTTWGSDEVLTTGSSYWQEHPCVVTDRQNRVHVVYTEFETFHLQPIVHYKRSANGGVSWGSEDDIAQTQGDFAAHTSLASDLANGLFVLYSYQTGMGFTEYDNFLVRSTDGGITWGSGLRLTTSMTAHWGSVAADTLGRVHVVYVEAPAGVRHVFYRRSTNSGQSFSPAVQLTTGNSDKTYGSIYTDRTDMIHVAWRDNRDGNPEIYYIRSTDGGISWDSETRLTDDPGTSKEPNITADLNGGVYLVWTDDRPDEDVYFKYSTDSGNTWSDDTCLTDGAVAQYGQFFSNIACSETGNYLHVAWSDNRDGNREVYYKRGYSDVGIREEGQQTASSSKMQIFPNPFTTGMSVTLQGASLKYPVELKIYDASGSLVLSRPLVARTSYLGTDLKAGIYFISVGGSAKQKVVKVQ